MKVEPATCEQLFSRREIRQRRTRRIRQTAFVNVLIENGYKTPKQARAERLLGRGGAMRRSFR